MYLHVAVFTPMSYVVSLAANFLLSSCFSFLEIVSWARGAGFVASRLVNMTLQSLLVALFLQIIDEKWVLIPAMLICIPLNFFLVRFCFNGHFPKPEK